MKNPNRFYVYAHQRLDDNSIFYIGKGHGKRAESTSNRNRYWEFVVNKVGYRVLIIQDNMSETDAFTLEKYLIAFYGREDLGEGRLVNMSDGGEGNSGHIFTDESKIKMSRANKGKETWNKGKTDIYTAETKNKISEALKQYYSDKTNHPFFNKTHSDVAKQKIKEKRANQIITDETKKKLSESAKGCKWFTDGTNTFFIKPEAALPHYTLGRLKKNNK